jgi:hypothetical protein
VILALLAESALRSLLLGAAVWLVLRCLRVRNPQAHMTAWTVVLIASLLMPVLMRSLSVPLPSTPSRLTHVIWAAAPMRADAAASWQEAPASWPEATPPAAPPESGPSLKSTAPPAPAAGLRAGEVAPMASSGRPLAIEWPRLAADVYLAVVGVLGLRLLIGLLLTARLVRSARPIADGWAAGLDVRTSKSVNVPVTFGSTILLPLTYVDWSPAKRRAVLLHEASHVGRGDFYVLSLAALHRAIFWFNPLSWWLVARLSELAEIISDDAAIAVLDDRPRYAEILLEVARSAKGVAAGLSMARPATVRQRVERLLVTTDVAAHLGSRQRLLIAAALIPLIAMSAVSVRGAPAPARPIGVTYASSEPFTVAGVEGNRALPDTKLLDAYVGYYAADPSVFPDLVFTITREGQHLFAQSTGFSKLELFAESDHTFFCGMVDAQLTFSPPSRGRAGALVLHQDGRDVEATRVDATAAKRAWDLFDQRFADQARPRTALAVDPSVLDRHVGYYQLNPRAIFSITREGDRLFAQLTDQARFQLLAESADKYFYQAIAAQVTFVADHDGRTSGLVLHQAGRNRPAARVDEQQARETAAKAQERVRRRAEQERPRVPAAIDPDLLDRYAGLYERGPSSIFTVTREGDRLFAQLTGQPKFGLFAESASEFFYATVAAQITFLAGDAGPASELVLHQNGRDFRAARIADVPRRELAADKIDTATLDRHAGWYEFDPTRALAVSREDDRLTVQETGRAQFAVLAVSAEQYVSERGDAFVIFNHAGEGPAELLLQESGEGARRAVRVDEARAKLIEAAYMRRIAVLPDRFRDQMPADGSRAALLQGIANLQRGAPAYDRMSPTLAEEVRGNLPRLLAMLTALGPVESSFFRGVSPGGYDIYGVKFAHGSAEFRIRPGAEREWDDVIFRPAGDVTPGGIVACSEGEALKARLGTAPVRLTLLNATGGDVRVLEVTFDGKHLPYSTIADERFGDVLTYVDRPIVIADASGQCREIVLPGQRTRHLMLRPFSADGQPNQLALPRLTPISSSEDRLLQLIETLRRGEPAYDQMTPGIARSMRQDLLLFQAILAKLGATRATSFRGVNAFDSDIYVVQFANGSAEWRIGLNDGGKIRQLWLGPGNL